MLSRRRSLGATSAGLFAGPLAAEAQQVMKIWRIGILTGTAAVAPRWDPFLEGLRDFGYVEGRNIALEWRGAGGRAERFPDLAADLVRRQVDVIVAGDNPAIAAAQKATGTIPIVMVLAMVPVASGFAGSLAKPGGNITGLTVQATELQGKTLQLLKEIVLTASRVAVLWDPTEQGRQIRAVEAEAAGRALGLYIGLVQARGPATLESLFAAIVHDRMHAVLVHQAR